MTSTPPPHVAGPALRHLARVMARLRSRSATGPTVYALTITGVGPDSPGTATLTSPATAPRGLTAGWPRPARDAALALFGCAAPRYAGCVIVAVVLRAGGTSHCALAHIPAAEPPGAAE